MNASQLKVDLPHARTPLLNGDGTATRPYYTFFQDIPGWAATVDGRLTTLESNEGGGTTPSFLIIGNESVAVTGSVAAGAVTLSLTNDLATVNSHYRYGTDGGGNKGWQAVFSDFASTTNIAPDELADGTVTFNLTTVTPATGGTLQKYGFDTFGRLSEQASASSDDLPEGTANLYASAISATALTALSMEHVVAVDGAGNAYYPDLTNPSDVAAIVGLTLHAAALGAPVQIVNGRTFTEPTWSWVKGPIFCALSGGGLTQSPASTGAIVEVGRAISSTTIYAILGVTILR